MDNRGRFAIKSSLLALAVAAAGLLGSVQSASAQTPFDFNPSGGAGATYNITGLGFGPGNALAVNSLPTGAPLKVGDTFQVYFQTHLTSLSGPNAPAFVPGLNGTPGAAAFQITEVATLNETVASVTNTAAGQTATFTLNPGAIDRISIYQSPGVTFNDAAGTGFTAGTEIARLSPISFTGSNFTNQSAGGGAAIVPFNQTGAGNGQNAQSITGAGGTGVFATTQAFGTNPLGYNVAFFQPPTGTPQLVSSLFNSNLATPFSALSPSLLFTNPITGVTIAPTIGATNGITGPDVQFQVSGITQTFAVVPEPASVTLMGLGVVGALFVVGRKRAQVA